MRPQILLFFEYGTLNGGEFSLLAVLQRLHPEAFEFVAAVPSASDLGKRLAGLNIPCLPLCLRDTQGKKLPSHETSAHLEDLIGQVSPDLVHANSLSMGRMLGRVATQLSIPCTAHLRDIINLSKAAIADLNQNTGLVAVSHATRDCHVQQGLRADKEKVIYNGVDTDVFSPNASSGILKQQLGLGDDTVLVASIGQICLRKGQTLLARAAVSLAQAFPEVNYLLVGERYSRKQESVAYENRIQQIFGESGIEDRLFCLGFRDDVPQLLNEIDLLVHTAHQEPLGRVLLEAAACGRAIVATDVGGTREILSDGKSAVLIPPNNVEALTLAIRDMLQDRERRQALGCQARQQVLRKFTISQAASQTRTFWESLL